MKTSNYTLSVYFDVYILKLFSCVRVCVCARVCVIQKELLKCVHQISDT